jgi:isoleucyl-tRNA synthetase
LSLKTNQEIENFGVENFIKECYRFTNLANDDRNWTVPNIGRRVDMNNAYETMSNDYMESVWHVFKTIYDQNKIYKGKRVSMYSTKLNTAVGNFEVQADNSYAEINDPAITVKFGLRYPLENKEIESFEITNDG